MLKNIIQRLFGTAPRVQPSAEKQQEFVSALDPLEPISRRPQGWGKTEEGKIKLMSPADFPLYIPTPAKQYIGDAKGIIEVEPEPLPQSAMDAGMGEAAGCARPDGHIGMESQYTVPEALMGWYLSQSFIGHQACAIIAQNWLVDKACSQSGEDAVRNGWEIKADGGDDMSDDDLNRIRDFDIHCHLNHNLTEMHRFMNVFGIRIVIFDVESDDPEYYEKPFNIDGVREGSYRGMSQVDPYWVMPMMTSECMSNPAGMHFYDPEYWIISGKKYHRSHLVISRGPQPADILKPTYIFGGIPLTQRIYERVYAAERTANEAPLLALSKRTTAIHVDTEKAVANEEKFMEKILFWVKYRDNHAIKVLGKEESMEQFDTNLADFDSLIMNQFQLVAAIAKTPATKILGTSPGGFNSNGDFETLSYHEELESIQNNGMQPLLERHYLLSSKSLGLNIGINVVWNPVDSVTTEKQADLNDKKATTAETLIRAGIISPDEDRQRLKDDKDSGYNRLKDSDANDNPGMSPENIAALQKAGAEAQKGEAAVETAGARQVVAGAKAQEPVNAEQEVGANVQEGASAPENTQQGGVKTLSAPVSLSSPETAKEEPKNPNSGIDLDVIRSLLEKMTRIEEHFMPEGKLDEQEFLPRTSKPSTLPTTTAAVRGIRDVVPEMDKSKLPKMKMGGLMLAIENPRNTVRKGESVDGPWQCTMAHHYGFIKNTTGADGDEVDCFVGMNPKSQRVFVINQNDANSGEFDEHKCMLGFDSPEEAKEGYMACYSDGWEGFGDMVELTMDEFKVWVNGTECSSPLNKACISQTTTQAV